MDHRNPLQQPYLQPCVHARFDTFGQGRFQVGAQLEHHVRQLKPDRRSQDVREIAGI